VGDLARDPTVRVTGRGSDAIASDVGDATCEGRPRHVRIELAGFARPVAAARRTVTDHCNDRVPAHVIDDLRIIVSELVSNVLEHGDGSRGLTLELTVRAREVDVQVTGIGDRRQVPPSSEWRLPPPLQRSGRGLALVRRLSPWVTVDGDDAVRDRGGWIAILASLPIPAA
jgi:anti-sigma regulatory factor (Ser/Thr protein kinase)